MSNVIQPEMPKLQAYRVNLSKGDPLPCDTDELPQVILSIKTGSPCRIRAGIFNPSYYVSVTEDRERLAEVERDNTTIRQMNDQENQYGKGKTYEKYKTLQPLKDIFEGLNLSEGTRLQKPSEGNRSTELPIATPKKTKSKEVGGYRRK